MVMCRRLGPGQVEVRTEPGRGDTAAGPGLLSVVEEGGEHSVWRGTQGGGCHQGQSPRRPACWGLVGCRECRPNQELKLRWGNRLAEGATPGCIISPW